MSELRALLADTTQKVLSKLDGVTFADAWERVAAAGLHKVLVPEDQGGFGGGWADAFVVVRACGYHGVALPLPEAILAAFLCAKANLPVADGPLSLCTGHQGTITDGLFSGDLWYAPYGAQCAVLAGIGSSDGQLIVTTGDAAALAFGVATNPTFAGDSFHFAKLPVHAGRVANWDHARVEHHLMLLRAGEMAGAMRAALDLSVRYVGERQQFGKKLAAFQAIQQQLAVMAEETAATEMAAAAAFATADREPPMPQPDRGLLDLLKASRAGLTQPPGLGISADMARQIDAELERRMPHMLTALARRAPFEFTAAKLRANMAVGTVTAIAHQVHGAIGFTAEYQLQAITKRLWAWRGQRGSDRVLAGGIGAAFAQAGPDGFWQALVSPATIAATGEAD